MLLPNKLFSYNNSILSKLPLILRILNTPTTPKKLYLLTKNYIAGPVEFLEILDCLYAMRKIDIDTEGRLYKC